MLWQVAQATPGVRLCFLRGNSFLPRHGVAMVLVLFRHGFAIFLVLLRHGFAMVLALLNHGSCHGAGTFYAWF